MTSVRVLRQKLNSQIAGTVSTLGAWYYDLPTPSTTDIGIERDIEIPVGDEITLRADRYYPKNDSHRPLILIRTPYGRRGAWGIYSRWFAERGYQVLIQSCRGTADSDGSFEPLVNEAHDGVATVRWIRDQNWFGSELATWGPSYLGYNQWALASEEIPELRAMAIQVAPSEFHNHFLYPGGAFAVGNALGFLQVIDSRILRDSSTIRTLLEQLTARRTRTQGASEIPLQNADNVTVGQTMNQFQRWIDCDTPAQYWDEIDHRENVENMQSVHLVAGWHDFFLPAMIADYSALREAGRPVRLVIGPDAHGAGQTSHTLNDQFRWFENQLLDEDASTEDAQVHIHVMGTESWYEFNDWPPEGCTSTELFLHPNEGLRENLPPESGSDSYQYDPADPTPNIGGPIIGLRTGPRDQAKKESRDDVLTYTSYQLEDDIDVIGPVIATLYVSSSRPHTDFYIGVCDVDSSDISRNVCDGLLRITPEEHDIRGEVPVEVEIQLRPTAYRFKKGHRIRVQVASGAFPRWSRNPGTEACLAEASTLESAEQRVYHDPDAPSSIHLPTISDLSNQSG